MVKIRWFRPLTRIGVRGLKSHRDWTRIDIKPLTLLAGSNSSGKSSVMQALLLLKQTMEAPYDPGALKLSGPNVQFTSFDQILWGPRENSSNGRELSIELTDEEETIRWHFARQSSEISLIRMEFDFNSSGLKSISESSSSETIEESLLGAQRNAASSRISYSVKRSRCDYRIVTDAGTSIEDTWGKIGWQILKNPELLIHVPGLRGNPQRSYPVTRIGEGFPGEFQNYVASLIEHWKDTDHEKLDVLRDQLRSTGLSSTIETKRLNDTEVEIHVGRLPVSSNESDIVSVADVGFGVSQVLPVMVGLLAAEEEQLVYIEQPEIHLHPRAQLALADVLIAAAERGVIVVAETHSSILLKAIQTRVARGDLSAEQTRLHWFTRDPNTGETKVDSTQLDERGRYGDWPEDFSDVELEVEDQFLSASEQAGE